MRPLTVVEPLVPLHDAPIFVHCALLQKACLRTEAAMVSFYLPIALWDPDGCHGVLDPPFLAPFIESRIPAGGRIPLGSMVGMDYPRHPKLSEKSLQQIDDMIGRGFHRSIAAERESGMVIGYGQGLYLLPRYPVGPYLDKIDVPLLVGSLFAIPLCMPLRLFPNRRIACRLQGLQHGRSACFDPAHKADLRRSDVPAERLFLLLDDVIHDGLCLGTVAWFRARFLGL